MMVVAEVYKALLDLVADVEIRCEQVGLGLEPSAAHDVKGEEYVQLIDDMIDIIAARNMHAEEFARPAANCISVPEVEEEKVHEQVNESVPQVEWEQAESEGHIAHAIAISEEGKLQVAQLLVDIVDTIVADVMYEHEQVNEGVPQNILVAWEQAESEGHIAHAIAISEEDKLQVAQLLVDIVDTIVADVVYEHLPPMVAPIANVEATLNSRDLDVVSEVVQNGSVVMDYIPFHYQKGAIEKPEAFRAKEIEVVSDAEADADLSATAREPSLPEVLHKPLVGAITSPPLEEASRIVQGKLQVVPSEEQVSDGREARDNPVPSISVDGDNEYDEVYATLWLERKNDLERKAEHRAKHTFMGWQRDRRSLEEVIDSSLKDYIELYESAHALRLQFEAEKLQWSQKLLAMLSGRLPMADIAASEFQYNLDEDADDESNSKHNTGTKRSLDVAEEKKEAAVPRKKFVTPKKH